MAPAIRKRLRVEACLLAIVSFPLVLVATAAFDLAFILVGFVPRLMFFVKLEDLLPSYKDYRFAIEVILEALPQVPPIAKLLLRAG